MFATPSNHLLESLKNDFFREHKVIKTTQKRLFSAKPHPVCFPSIPFSFEDEAIDPFLESMLEARKKERVARHKLITPRNSKKQRSRFSFETESTRKRSKVVEIQASPNSAGESEISFLETNANSVYEKSSDRSRKIKKAKKVPRRTSEHTAKALII